MSQHLCFFSTRCKFSQIFLEELSKTPYSKEFRFVCVDVNPATGQRPQLPAYVRAVPTLMISGEAAPRTDNQVMNWLSERKLTEKKPAQRGPSGGAKGGAGGGGGGGGADDGLAAFGGEVMGYGDEGFAFIGEEAAIGEGKNVRLTGSMVSLDNMHLLTATNAKPTGNMMASAASGGPQKTAKASAFDDALAAYTQSRSIDLAPPTQRR